MKLKKLVLITAVFALLITPAAAAQDTVSSASVVVDDESLINAMSAEGSWIVIFTEDYSTDKELVLEGEFTNRGEVARKLALYDQDEQRNITDRYTLETPKLTVKSENTSVKGGVIAGDVYVEAEGFELDDATIDGDLYFTTSDAQSSFVNNGTVNGEIKLLE
ncbi:MAG: hypothetical protein ACQESS_09475 [Bacillota bacterium]